MKQKFNDLQGDTPYCEACGTSQSPIDMAHSRKRADIGWRTDQDRLDYLHAAMLCRYHHNLFELGKTHEEMYNLITDVIDNRPGGAFK